jgi:phage baseplate assembly protein W
MAKWFGFNAPFLTPNSVLPPQYDERIIKNDLLMLLLTRPGERRGRSKFGTPLKDFPFEQGDQESLDKLQRDVKAAIDVYEERVLFKKMTVTTNVEGTAAIVKLFVALRDAPTRTFTVDITFPFQTTG